MFGFFTHPDLSLSNFALTDIVAALDWLQRHVAAFGGDPHNITLMGESSGGNNILHLLSSPIAKNRFQRAIVQSAGWAVSGRTNRFKQLQLASELTEELSPSVKGLSGLRAISAEEILKASEKVFANHFFDVVVDGTTLVEPTGQSMRYGRLGPVEDLLIGSNLDEWRSYLPATANIENTEDLRLSQDGKRCKITSRPVTTRLVRWTNSSLHLTTFVRLRPWQILCSKSGKKSGVTSLLNTAMVKCHMQKARITELNCHMF